MIISAIPWVPPPPCFWWEQNKGGTQKVPKSSKNFRLRRRKEQNRGETQGIALIFKKIVVGIFSYPQSFLRHSHKITIL